MNAETLLHMPGPCRKYLYLWNFEWVFKKNGLYNDYAKIYLNEDLNILTRSKSHQRIFLNTWSESEVLEDFNNEKIVEIAERR